MDKNTVTGWILIVLVVIGFMWYGQPSQQEIDERMRQDSIAAAQQVQQMEDEALQVQNTMQQAEAAASDSASLFFAHRSGEGEKVVLENDLVQLTLNTKGGTVQRAVLKNYLKQHTDPVVLFDETQSKLQLLLDTKAENIRTADLVFTPVDQDQTHVTMRLEDATRGRLDIVYSLQPDGYMLSMDVRATGMQNTFASTCKTLNIQWMDRAYQQEKGFDFENRYSSLTYKKAGAGTKYLSETSEEHKQPEEALDWVAFKNQFFSCILIAHQDFTHADLHSTPEKDKNSGYLKTYKADLQTAFDPTGAQPTQLQMYIGPNDFHVLQDANAQGSVKKDLELEKLIYFGWPIVRWINRWFILYLFDWLTGWGLSMGVVLLLLTLIVKLLVYPTTKKSYLSSAKMRVLKPKVDELNAKYPKQEDAMKKQQEMMQLYSQYGVSPMGGCLPMLIQMPIWIALFNFVPNAIELRGQSFLWADDLSAYDELINWGTDLWLIGDHLSIFCLLFCATNVINTVISMKQQQNSAMSPEQEQQMKMMRWMMYLMPVMFFFMFNNYSSGLCYYYFLSGLTSILMTWYLRKTTDDKKLLAKLEAYRDAHKNDPKKTSSLAARLEALQKMQEEQQRRGR